MKKILTIIITATILLSLIAAINIYVNAETTPTALTVTGLVDHPLNLTLAQLEALPKTTVNATIICVDAPGRILEEGNWIGVKLSVLLGNAGIQSGAIKIGIFASDGFSSDLPVQTAMQDNIILAYGKDDQALSSLRLVVPDHWGYKWVNQVTEIRAMDNDYLGFWESRGYSDRALVGQDPGVGSGAKPPQFSVLPTTPPPTSTPNPSATPTPTPTQNATTGSQATPAPTTQVPTQNGTVPQEAIYAVAIGIIAAIAVAALVVRKKVKK
jgi:DMSO/TMAO reductase YedYZ molybdopterin-dependent catalytic subunit